jgi:hypothetical protein
LKRRRLVEDLARRIANLGCGHVSSSARTGMGIDPADVRIVNAVHILIRPPVSDGIGRRD